MDIEPVKLGKGNIWYWFTIEVNDKEPDTYKHMHTHSHTSTHTYTHVRTRTHTYTHVQTRTHTLSRFNYAIRKKGLTWKSISRVTKLSASSGQSVGAKRSASTTVSTFTQTHWKHAKREQTLSTTSPAGPNVTKLFMSVRYSCS
jgi:hypothetical protein